MANADLTTGERKLFLWGNGVLAVAWAGLAVATFVNNGTGVSPWWFVGFGLFNAGVAAVWWRRLRRPTAVSSSDDDGGSRT